jgi:hypothetical protein
MTQVQNTKINLGTIKNTSKDLVVNLSDLSFCMVIGYSAMGKTFWVNNIYEQLCAQLSNKEIGWVLVTLELERFAIDDDYLLEAYLEEDAISALQGETLGFGKLNKGSQLQEHYLAPSGIKFKHPIDTLVEYAELAKLRAKGSAKKDKHIIVHIEKSELIHAHHHTYIESIIDIAKNAKKANMSLFLVDNHANKILTPPEMLEHASLVALFMGNDYIEDYKNNNEETYDLDKYEKQIIFNNKTYVVDKNLK